MIKWAGLLDKPKETLPTDVWDLSTLEIYPEIRGQILELINEFLPSHIVQEVFIIGSITGYKYKETSDIDINVNIDVPMHSKSKEFSKYKKLGDLHSGTLAIGTRHPINFFVDKFFKPSTPKSWQDYKFGNYDVIKNKWLKSPPERSSVRNPDEQFREELLAAELIANKWIRASEELRKDMDVYEELKKKTDSLDLEYLISSKQREIEKGIKDLIAEAKSIKKRRQWSYDIGYGIPRYSFNNIVFKLIEHGQYGELFEFLKSVRKDEI